MLGRNARYNVLNAVASSVALNLINPYIGIFAVKLNATDLQLGYLSSWPNLVSVIAVLGAAAAVARSDNKKRLIAAILLVGRVAALGAAAVPWFPESARVWALIGFWVLAVFPSSAAGTAMQSFLADVFQGNERVQAFASRNTWATAAGMVVIPVSGWMLDQLFDYPGGYQIVFVASFAAALLEIYYFMKLEERPALIEAGTTGETSVQPKGRKGRGGLSVYLETFSHRPFLLFLLVSIPFHFTWQAAWPIFTRYQVTDLLMNNSWLGWTTVANQLGQILTYPLWARLSERHGNLLMMWLATLNVASAPFLTAAVPSVPWLILVNIWTGIGLSGITLLILNNLLDVSPAEDRPVYLAVHSALVSISATIAPMAGAFIMSSMSSNRMALSLSSIPRVVTSTAFLLLFWYQTRKKGREPLPEKPRP